MISLVRSHDVKYRVPRQVLVYLHRGGLFLLLRRNRVALERAALVLEG
jgi:hypothetical protein